MQAAHEARESGIPALDASVWERRFMEMQLLFGDRLALLKRMYTLDTLLQSFAELCGGRFQASSRRETARGRPHTRAMLAARQRAPHSLPRASEVGRREIGAAVLLSPSQGHTRAAR